jgi:hypothetical protein
LYVQNPTTGDDVVDDVELSFLQDEKLMIHAIKMIADLIVFVMGKVL